MMNLGRMLHSVLIATSIPPAVGPGGVWMLLANSR